MRKLFRGILLLICACVPGCGQMQQGYMKRGISQTIAFSAMLAVAIFLEIGALACFLAPLWAYSFFDAYNLRRLTREGMPQEDAYLFGLSDMDSKRLEELVSKRHSLIGWVLVSVGVLVMWQNFARTLYDLLMSLFGGDDAWWIYDLMHGVPRMVVTLLIIALGIWFIRGPRKKPEDSIPDFTPPEEPFTAKSPYSAEAQVPVALRLYPEDEEPAPETETEENAETEEERHGNNG